MRRSLLLLASLAMLSTSAMSAKKAKSVPKPKRDSAYSNLVGKGCENPGEGELQCKGLDGWRLDIADEGNIINLRISRASAPNTILELNGRSLGERAEWRGVRTRSGVLPDALILRMRPVEDDARISSIIYIVKLKPAEACLSGIVDANVNPDANKMARLAADKLPDVCNPHPQVYGLRSPATDLFLS